MSFVSSLWGSCLAAGVLLSTRSLAFTGSEYRLDAEYSGTNFFDGWDFYSDRDPTGGTVTYYSRSSAELTGLTSTSEDGPAYMGVNYVDTLPYNNATGSVSGAGRPSVRIASKQAWTHGLFIGDFQHIPAGICGTWPAFWTLGPNWPYTGEVDILEGVNLNGNNVMSLHTNETCTITGDDSVMSGTLENTNCAYYPDYNVGCGVSDPHSTSYGIRFNQAQGGVYAMQWTSEYIRIWQWSRDEIPSDVDNDAPDPSSWGLPTAQLGVGNCTIDQHFQAHKIIFDTTFCGAYAGLPSVWNTNDDNSCAAYTGLDTCDNYVANHPEAFRDAYWSVNYVRVYQLVDPDADTTTTPYIASEQPATTTIAAPNVIATPNINTDALCPTYNYSIITDGTYDYEIACDVDVPGPDLTGEPYQGFHARSMANCLEGCTYMNENNGTNVCGGVIHYAPINFCYFKKYFDAPGTYRPGYNEIRLIYYGYPEVTDNLASRLADSTATSVFIETIPTPQTYRGTNSPTITTTTLSADTASTTSKTTTVGIPGMGDNSTSTTTTSGVGADYSQTVTEGYNTSSIITTGTTPSPVVHTSITTVTDNPTTSAAPSTITSTSPIATNADFYVTFNVPDAIIRLMKRAIKYLAFDESGESTLVDSESEATPFHLDAADNLMTSGDSPQYVVIDMDVNPPRFSLQETVPDAPVTVKVDGSGSVSFAGVHSYCLTLNGDLAIITDSSDAPSDCQAVVAELVGTPDDSISTTTDTASTTSIGGSGSVSSTTSDTAMTTETGHSSNPTSTSDSTSISTAINTDTSTSASTTFSPSSGSPTSTAHPINNFIYAGCRGIPLTSASIPGISDPYTSDSMTNELCTSHCSTLGTPSLFAATHNNTCFCASTLDLYMSLLDYPDQACNTPCPGANREMCGGDVGFQGEGPTSRSSPGRLGRRQAALLLISLYNNTDIGAGPGQSDIPTTETGDPTGTSTNDGSATDTTHTTLPTLPTGTDTVNGGGIPTFFPADQVSYAITGTNTATVLSTTYIDVCPVCPGGLTTHATTITIPHCGCTASYDELLQTVVAVPSPSVPMVTTVKQCACGEGGVASTVTVTVPHTRSIAQLVAVQGTGMMIAAPAASGGLMPSNLAATAAAPTMGSLAASPASASASALGQVAAAATIANPGKPDNAVVVPVPIETPTSTPIDINHNLATLPQPQPSLAVPTPPSNIHANSTISGISNYTVPVPASAAGSGVGIQSYKSSASKPLNRLLNVTTLWPWTSSRYLLSSLVGAVLMGMGLSGDL